MKTGAIKRGAIGLGDLVRAIGALQPLTETEVTVVARSLGFAIDPTTPERSRPTAAMRGAWNRTRYRKRPQSDRKQPAFSPRPGMPPAAEAPPELPEAIVPTRLERLPPATPEIVAVPDSIARQQPLRSTASKPVARASLFSDRTARGLLVPAVAQPARGGDPDIGAIVDAFVRCRPLPSLPTRTRRSTRNGCQLLLDYSEALMPWWPDLRHLKTQLHALLGAEACPVYEFEGDPAQAVCWSAVPEQPWAPVAGVPVIAATDLATVRPRTTPYRPGPETWVRFARACQRRQVPLIALVPVEPHRWPKRLDRLIRLIHWNPATDAASVQRLNEGPGSERR